MNSYKILLPFLFILTFKNFLIYGQDINADFILPTSICVGETVFISNITTGGNSFYWNFCSGDANTSPVGINIGNFYNLLNIPTYVTLIKDKDSCFSFVSNQGIPGLVRYYHGASYKNNPIYGEILGNFGGMITSNMEGLQILNDKGIWYGFIACDNNIIRLIFGNSLSNKTPFAQKLGPLPVNLAHCVRILNENGIWIGFLSGSFSNNLIRLNFGTNLSNDPVFIDLGNLAGFVNPGQFVPIVEEDSSYILLLSSGNATLCRISFGSSFLNNPLGKNLGNVGFLQNPGGFSIIQDCNSISGYFTKYQSPGLIGKLSFPNGISGNIIGTIVGNLGDLDKPHTISEIFRERDTLITYVTNRGSNTYTQLFFPPCNNASVPSSALYSPPPYVYNQPGTYNVRLLINEGQFNQVSLCKQITVYEKNPAFITDIDTLLCFGVPYFAGGEWRTTPGIYYDTINSSIECIGDTIVKTILNFKPDIPLALGNDTTICSGWPYVLWTHVSQATFLWQDGSTDSTYAVFKPGKYWVKVTKDGCSKTDSIHFGECGSSIWFPNVFTPNSDGLNDTFHPLATGIDKYHITIYNRWGERLFESNSIEPGWDGTFNGALCPEGVYVFISTYETEDSPNIEQKAHGSITLLR